MSEWTLQHPWMTLLIAYWVIGGTQRSVKSMGRFILALRREAKTIVDADRQEKADAP